MGWSENTVVCFASESKPCQGKCEWFYGPPSKAVHRAGVKRNLNGQAADQRGHVLRPSIPTSTEYGS